MNWTEGHIHLYMRRILESCGWSLIAGEYPGGSDHELYPLNVVDRAVARDNSPDPRRHSLGELIPDIVALKGRFLLIGEAKVSYNDSDRQKLDYLLINRHDDLLAALGKFVHDRGFTQILPLSSLIFLPTLIFAKGDAPVLDDHFGIMKVISRKNAEFYGSIAKI